MPRVTQHPPDAYSMRARVLSTAGAVQLTSVVGSEFPMHMPVVTQHPALAAIREAAY
jgi:hypothetical protein